MNSQQKFEQMLEMQIALNDKTYPTWRTADLPWKDAIWTECAELMDHVGWKWWKKQEPNMEQARLEVVDIWHFGMSKMMVDFNESIPTLASYLTTREQRLSDPIKMNPRTVIRALAKVAAEDMFSTPTFFDLMNSLDMSLNDLYTIYMGKNILNTFRTENGYKEGTYIKSWHGEEDNVWLNRFVEHLNPNLEGFPVVLKKLLENKYKVVLEGEANEGRFGLGG